MIDLHSKHLARANLRGADLRREVDLLGADLHEANLQEANLSGIYLGGANLQNADLRNANLQGTELVAADLRGANLKGADLRGADLSKANLDNADLSGVRGLEEAFLQNTRYNALTRFPKGFSVDAIRFVGNGHTERAEKPSNVVRATTSAWALEPPVDPSVLPSEGLDVRGNDRRTNVCMKVNGNFWRIRFGDDKEALVDESKGLIYIHHLLRHDGEWVSSYDMLALTDPRVVEEEEGRLRELTQQLRDAQQDARDSLEFLGREDGRFLGEEVENAKSFYKKELQQAQDKMRSIHKNIYNRLSNNIRRTLENLEKITPSLHTHLRDCIKYRGGEWLYNPPEDEKVSWQLD